MTTTSPDWTAEVYHRISEPQLQWGLGVLAELVLQGDETVIDAGCGTGRLTSVLLERLAEGRVIAVDSSPAMLEVARRELASFGDRIAVVQADLAALALNQVADVVFSNATFHWVTDHDALARSLFQALRPKGRLHAQCGGAGNLAGFLARAMTVANTAAFASHFTDFKYPANFATPEETSARLERAGFEHVNCWLTQAPTNFETREAFAEFAEHVVLRNVLSRVPHELRQPLLEAIVDAGPWTLDYVRLNMRASR